jgi:RNA polymerase sigma-70 factor (ECF subfamily)
VADDGRPPQGAQRDPPAPDPRGEAATAPGPDDDALPEPDIRTIPDDRLRLIFTCCHPALAQTAQIALTLRLVCGLATPDIAQAFLVTEATMAARLTRAKKKIAAARIPYAVPSGAELPERVDAVLTVIHLLYASGHTAPSGDTLVRDDLTGRALDLARMLRRLLPADREAAGLFALLLVHQARRATRTDAQGRLLRLEQQDRSAWDRELIAEADRLVVAALSAGPPGRFTLQAAIAALHAQAPSDAETDWPQILTLYGELLRVWPAPRRRAQPGGRGIDGRWSGGRARRCRGTRARRPPRRPSLPARDEG